MVTPFPNARLLPAALLMFLPACMAGEPIMKPPGVAQFSCREGKHFAVEFYDGEVQVTTALASYRLRARQSSFGQKFASDEVVFIHDDDRGVLVGAAGGPFKQCVERS